MTEGKSKKAKGKSALAKTMLLALLLSLLRSTNPMAVNHLINDLSFLEQLQNIMNDCSPTFAFCLLPALTVHKSGNDTITPFM
jgi:hypothetical protein